MLAYAVQCENLQELPRLTVECHSLARVRERPPFVSVSLEYRRTKRRCSRRCSYGVSSSFFSFDTMLKGHTLLTRKIPSTFIRSYSSHQRPPAILPLYSPRRSLHLAGRRAFPRRRDFFSSNSTLRRENETDEHSEPPKRKHQRSPAGKNSLRRVAVEAQRSRDGKEAHKIPAEEQQSTTKVTSKPL